MRSRAHETQPPPEPEHGTAKRPHLARDAEPLRPFAAARRGTGTTYTAAAVTCARIVLALRLRLNGGRLEHPNYHVMVEYPHVFASLEYSRYRWHMVTFAGVCRPPSRSG